MDKQKLMICIGENIRKYRLQRDLSQEAVALSAKMGQTYLGRLERGEKCPTIYTLYKICNVLEISIYELLTFNDTPTINNEAKERIEIALSKIPESKHKKVVEFIENIVDLVNE